MDMPSEGAQERLARRFVWTLDQVTITPPMGPAAAVAVSAEPDRPLRDLALSVSRCPELSVAADDASHPCHKIVTSQALGPTWQVPEAWAGSLTAARIVFLSSNPGISVPKPGESPASAEKYPDATWSDDAVADFVTHRFPSYASEDGRHLRGDGTWSAPVRFWSFVRRIAVDVLGPGASPALDYVMTEVVHCKSKSEVGVAEAVHRCTERHLDRILAATSAPLLVVLGTKALSKVTKAWDLPPQFNPGKHGGEGPLVLRTIAGRQRVVAYLPHPANWGTAPLLSAAYPSQIAALRNAVNGTTSPLDEPSTERRLMCSRCARVEASWLVTGSDRTNAPGRLFTYCDRCREAIDVNVAIPLELALSNLPPVMRYLYDAQLTATDPDAVVDVLGLSPRGWIDHARTVLKAAHRGR